MGHEPEIQLKDDLLHSFNSADNERKYKEEFLIEGTTHPSSRFGLIVDGIPRIIIGASGGSMIIGEHTLIRAKDDVLFAIGPYVCSYSLSKFSLNWHLEVDEATCFGIHYSESKDAYISHGETTIARFDLSGRLVWQESGRDIFSEGFRLTPSFIEAIDFDENIYQFDYATGESKLGE